MELSTEEIRKAVNDAFDENMTEVDNWNDAVFYSSKEKFITDVVKKLTIPVVSDTLILTPKDAEVFFNEIMNPKDANEALKKAMLKFITR
jgi:hypothetical protein